MAKETKTAVELAEIIRSRVSKAVMGVRVARDPVHGWQANVTLAVPERAAEAQSLVSKIAAELRRQYDLEDQRSPAYVG